MEGNALYYRLEMIYRVADERFRSLMRQKNKTHAEYCENIAKIQLWRYVALEASFGMREIERGR